MIMWTEWIIAGAAIGSLLFTVMTGTVVYGTLKQKVADTSTRLDVVEKKLDSVSDLKESISVLRVLLENLKSVSETQNIDNKHDFSDLKGSVDKLSDVVMQLRLASK